MSRDNAPYRPVEPGLIARITGGMRSWLGMANTLKGGPEMPFFPPGRPLDPVAPGAVGRRFDYPTSYNVITRPRGYEPVDFETLRAVADPAVGGYDLIRLAIETRKDQFAKLVFSILPRKKPNQSNRPKSDERCQKMEELLRRPDGFTPWQQWVSQLLEEHLVIDAPAIYRRKSLAGETIRLELIDGAGIRPLLNYDGRRPEEGPAYQQVLKGLPAVDYTMDELLYAPRNPRVSKNYGMCVLPDHQVLTRRGWLTFTEVTLQDEIATRNQQTKAFEWQKPTRLITMPHRGEIYRFHSRNLDLAVTPDHNMLLDSLPMTANGSKKRTRGQRGEVLVRAEDVARGYTPMNKIPMTSTWQGIEVGEKTFALAEPEGTIEVTRQMANGREQTVTRLRHRGSERPITISGDDYCALLGAYMAEGNIRSQGGLEINQKAYSKGWAPYAQLMARVLGGPAQTNHHGFVLPRRGLTEHFKALGLQPERFIPDEVMQAPPRQLRLFWDHYILGDGSYEDRPNASGRGGRAGQPVERMVTTSERLAGQLMEIAQKLGWSASMHTRKGGPRVIDGRLCKTLDSYRISVRYSKAMNFTVTPDWYEGDVHCVTVPNSVIYVRRNGKPAWIGNSPVEQCLVTINIGLRRQAGQLAFFTDGNVPDAISQVPEGWTTAQIGEFQDYWDSMVNDARTRRKMRFVPAGAAIQRTRADDALVDQFDEWIARIIAYCFSLPPTPFVRIMNRATAENAYQVALDEGLQPLMIWLKGIIDYIMTNWLDEPDLELVWDEVRKADPAEKEQRDLVKTQNGIIGIDDMRADLGLEPLGVKPFIRGIGPLGFMSIDSINKAIANGWDLTGMPQAPMGGDMAAIPGADAGGDDPFAGLPPEIMQALGMDPTAPPGGAQQQTDIAAPGGQAGPVIGAGNQASNVVPIHQHPGVQAALAHGDRTAHHLAARMAGAR